MVITVPPGPLFAGVSHLTLTCTISINSATDISLMPESINVTWFKGAIALNLDSQEIAKSQSSHQTFISYLALPSLSSLDNNSNYTCWAGVTCNDVYCQGHHFINSSEINQHTVAIKVRSKSKFDEIINKHYRKFHYWISTCSSLR